MLRHCSCDNASVLLHMLEVIDTISQGTQSPESRQPLLIQVDLIQVESRAGALTEPDRQLIQRRAEALQSKLNDPARGCQGVTIMDDRGTVGQPEYTISLPTERNNENAS
jgi:hypothetical protein